MRNREVIEREMFRAREDLESSLAELKHVVQEKVDVKARAQVAFEKGKLMAADAFERGKQSAKHLAKKGEDKAYFTYLKAKDRPVLTASIIGGVVAAGVLFYVGRRKDWW
ncbi:MAG TPA: DUF3618 domain-containing protein [Kofleriaceae bacterium]